MPESLMKKEKGNPQLRFADEYVKKGQQHKLEKYRREKQILGMKLEAVHRAVKKIKEKGSDLVMVGRGKKFDVYLLSGEKLPAPLIIKKLGEVEGAISPPPRDAQDLSEEEVAALQSNKRFKGEPEHDLEVYQWMLGEGRKMVKAHVDTKKALEVVPSSYAANRALDMLREVGLSDKTLEKYASKITQLAFELKTLKPDIYKYRAARAIIENPRKPRNEEARAKIRQAEIMLAFAERGKKEAPDITHDKKKSEIRKTYNKFVLKVNDVLENKGTDFRKEVRRILSKRTEHGVPKMEALQMSFRDGPVQVFERIPNIIVQEAFELSEADKEREKARNVEVTILTPEKKRVKKEGGKKGETELKYHFLKTKPKGPHIKTLHDRYLRLIPKVKTIKKQPSSTTTQREWRRTGEEPLPYSMVKEMMPEFVKMLIQGEASKILLDAHPGNFGIIPEHNRVVYVDTSEKYGKRSIEGTISDFVIKFGDVYPTKKNEIEKLVIKELEKHVVPTRIRNVREHIKYAKQREKAIVLEDKKAPKPIVDNDKYDPEQLDKLARDAQMNRDGFEYGSKGLGWEAPISEMQLLSILKKKNAKEEKKHLEELDE